MEIRSMRGSNCLEAKTLRAQAGFCTWRLPITDRSPTWRVGKWRPHAVTCRGHPSPKTSRPDRSWRFREGNSASHPAGIGKWVAARRGYSRLQVRAGTGRGATKALKETDSMKKNLALLLLFAAVCAAQESEDHKNELAFGLGGIPALSQSDSPSLGAGSGIAY